MKQKLIIGFATLSLLVGVAGALSEYKVKEINVVAATVSSTDRLANLPVTKKSNPIILGQKNWDVFQNDTINVLDEVSAIDSHGETIKVTASEFSTKEVKRQTVTLTATDKYDNETKELITVNVKPKKIIEQPQETAINMSAPVEEAPIETQTVTYKEKPAQPTWLPYTMYLGGISIPYQNAGEGSGQSIIDSNRNMVATFGGATVQSPNDGVNTHFIGHNPGIFNILFSLSVGSEVTVTDANGTPATYIVGNIFQVDDYGTNIATNENWVDYILDPGTEERITLQTCVNDDINLVVVAFPA
ncbi:sortase domain-bontaining protein [Vagococcus fluvialis]|uniref:Sortase n=1 Tax=Vagococcus fluvialis TaxID=2738 RepID=A0A7X6DA71_9ENTE|nr:sortase [Vagococcus fluvialis]NKC68343.1 sortase [Vagococcus fluvialis]